MTAAQYGELADNLTLPVDADTAALNVGRLTLALGQRCRRHNLLAQWAYPPHGVEIRFFHRYVLSGDLVFASGITEVAALTQAIHIIDGKDWP